MTMGRMGSDGCGESGRSFRGAQWLVGLAGDPQAVQDDGELARHGDHSALLGVATATLVDGEAVATKIAILAEATEGSVREVGGNSRRFAPAPSERGEVYPMNHAAPK
jgi:hypothetical protein